MSHTKLYQKITLKFSFFVKTDAFTRLPSDLDRAKTLLDFSPGIGKWRVSKTEYYLSF